MKRKLCVFALSSLLSLSTAQANFFSIIQNKGLPKQSTNLKKSDNPDIQGCTNFSGAWKGICTMTDHGGHTTVSDITYAIEQPSCKTLIVNHKYLELDAINTETNPTYALATALDWNSDKTFLHLTESILVRIAREDKKHMSFSLNGEVKKEDPSKEDSKLILVLHSDLASGQCILSK